MRGGSLFRQASLLAVLWLMNYQGVTKFTEAKTLSNVDGDFRNDFAPNFIEHPTSRNIKEGRPLVLVCAAKGEPKPRIRWKKNGRTINADTRIKIKLNRNGTRSRLKIKKAMPGDSGDYHCVAKNGIRPTSSIKARVEIKRKIGPQPISGACKPYHGSVCSKFIPGDDRIFIALNNSQQQNEERILLAASILRDYTHSNCKDSLVKFLCFHLFPRCHGGKHPKPRYLCKDDCEVLQAATCSREFHLLERRLGTSAHRTIPDCSSLSDRGNCLSIVNKTIPRRECHHESGDVPEVEIKPFDKNYPMCRDVTSTSSSKLLNGRKSVKFQNKNILPLVRYVKSKILSGQIVMFSKSGEESTFCFTASLPLTSLVRGWNGFHKTSLPPNLRRPNNITVPGLIVSTQNSSISEVLVPLGSAEKYKVHEKVVLKNVKFYYREQSGQGSFIAKGEYNLCGTIFKTTVEKLLDGTIKIKGFSDLPIDLSKIETVFVSVSPPNWLVDAIKRTELLVLRLMKPVMEAYVTSDLVVKFSGETYFGPTTLPVYVEFFGGKLQGQDLLLAGITSPRLTINDALGMLIDFTIPYLDHLNNSKPNGSTVGITLSANTLNLLKTPYGGFNEEPLHQAFTGAVPFGLSLVTSGSLPVASQSSSQLMKLFQAVIGRESEFTVKATADWKDIKLNWRFHNVSKKAVSPFDRVEMTLKLEGSHYPVFPSTPLMAIVDGAFYSDDRSFKRLPFTGQLIYQDHNSMIEGEFETQGAWNNAFGIDFLTAKKLKLGALFSTNQSQKSKITGKADLQMGLNCHATGDDNGIDSIKRDCVRGNIFVGFSDTSAEHFFYGTLTPVSLQKLLEICNINHKLPGAMSTIGFPEGFQISFARKVHDLRKFGGLVLQPGFLLKGKISVLGIETNGVISLLPKEFLVNAKVTSDKAPEMIDDVTSMFLYDADKDHNSKLFLKARMDPVPFVKARIDGYARLFGIFEEVRMLATRDAFQIYLTTDSDKSFKISVQITTNYSLGRNHTQLSANVIFENGLSKLTRAASKQVVTLLEQEMSQIKSAKGAVQRLRRKCAKTIKQDCSICNKDKLCASSLSQCAIDTGAKMVLNASRAKYDSKRANATKTDNCQRLVMARCLATDTTCFNACRFLSSNTNKTCAGYQADAASQRKRERRLRWVKRAEQFMNSDLFQIHAISFKTNVSSTNLQHLSMDTSLEVTIFGQREKINGLRIDFNDFVNLSSEIAKYAWEWYEKAQPKPRHPDNRPRSPA